GGGRRFTNSRPGRRASAARKPAFPANRLPQRAALPRPTRAMRFHKAPVDPRGGGFLFLRPGGAAPRPSTSPPGAKDARWCPPRIGLPTARNHVQIAWEPPDNFKYPALREGGPSAAKSAIGKRNSRMCFNGSGRIFERFSRWCHPKSGATVAERGTVSALAAE